MMTTGWDASAEAWIKDMKDGGDFSRRFVLDRPMQARVRASGAKTALDVGCGEGRFARMMAREGLAVTGLDPTLPLLEAARAAGGGARYVQGRAEALPFEDDSFDLVVAYLSLIDIEDLSSAYAEMMRVLAPGGRLLFANLSSFATAIPAEDLNSGWLRRDGGGCVFGCDDYATTRDYWIGWRGIRVRNFHRPMRAYMAPLLEAGMTLTHFDEPLPTGGPPDKVERYSRAPIFVLMEWQRSVLS